MGLRYHKPHRRRRGVWDPIPPPPIRLAAPFPTTIRNFTMAWNDPPLHPYNQAAMDNFLDAFLEDDRYMYARRLERDVLEEVFHRWFRTLKERWMQANVNPLPADVVASRRIDKASYSRRHRVSNSHSLTLHHGLFMVTTDLSLLC